jgi:phospholipid/cholesterol/gamma-HCH transport system substrate-binding protein
METRASYIAVGAFFLLLLLGGIVFALWASKYSSSIVMVNHYLRVDGSVAGLTVGSGVLFGGIPIGKVTRIEIDPVDPTLTRIEMTVRADAPIRTDSVGVLASKSLIGGAIIEISRGSSSSPRLRKDEILAGQSSWERLITGAPKLAEKVASLQDQLDRFMTPQNTVALVRILANADRLSTEFSQLSSQFNGFYDRTNASSAEVKKAWAEISQALTDIGKNGNRLMEDANKAIADATRTGNRLGQSRDKLDQLLNENSAAFKDFESNGYPQLPALMADLKKLVRNYTRLWAEIREDPGRFFLGDRSQGYQP